MENKVKILCIEQLKEGFDSIPLDEVRKMVGYYEPENGKWKVTTMDGIYMAETQFEAQTISSLEQIKALLIDAVYITKP